MYCDHVVVCGVCSGTVLCARGFVALSIEPMSKLAREAQSCELCGLRVYECQMQLWDMVILSSGIEWTVIWLGLVIQNSYYRGSLVT